MRNYRVEIKLDQIFRDVTEYLVGEPKLRQNAEGEFEWSFWFDEYELKFISAFTTAYSGLKKSPVIIYYHNKKIVNGYIMKVVDESEENETIDITVSGYDRLFCETRIAYGKYESFAEQLSTISEVVSALKGKVDNNLQENGYYTKFISSKVNCQDNIDFIQYKTFDLDEFEMPTIDLPESSFSHYQKGFMIELQGNPVDADVDMDPGILHTFTLDLTDLNWDNIYTFTGDNDLMLFGEIGQNVLNGNWQAEIYSIDSEGNTEEYLIGTSDKYKDQDFITNLNDNTVTIIRYGDRFFRLLSSVKYSLISQTALDGELWSTWKSYMESLFVGGDITQAEIKNLVVVGENTFYYLVKLTFSILTADGRDTESELHYYKGDMIEKDLISYFYSRVRAGQILKDILKLTDNIAYFDVDGTIYIKDRETGRGSFEIKPDDIISKSVEIKNVEFEDFSSVNLPQGTGNNASSLEPIDNSGNGIIVMEGEPFDIAGQIRDYYSNLVNTKKEETVKLTLLYRDEYMWPLLKKSEYGIVTDVTYKDETIDMIIKKRE